MTRVLCLSEMYPNSSNAYGGSFVHRQNEALAEKGVEIEVVAPLPWIPFPLSRKDSWRRLNQIPEEEMLNRIRVYHPRRAVLPKAAGFHLNGYSYYLCLRNLVRRRWREFGFDLIHSHVAMPDGVAGALLGRDVQKPLVITVHGKDTANAQWSTIHLNPRCKRAIAQALQSASKVVAVSHYVKRTLLEAYPDLEKEKVAVIQGGVNPHSMALEKTKRRHPAKTLVSVGALIPLKGHRYTIEAMKKVVRAFPQSRLVIVGEGYEKAGLMDQVVRAGLSRSIEFLDILPQDQLFKLMAASDLFVLPSWAEGLGMVYLEAMGLGLPVIGCRGQGVEDIVLHGETGFLVTPKDSVELAELILMALTHDELRERIGRAGQQFVLSHLRWEDNAKKHLALYEPLISASGGLEQGKGWI